MGKKMFGLARRHYAVISAKMSKQIEMPFGLCARVGPWKHALHGSHIGATWRIRLIRPYSGGPNEAAAMRPDVKLHSPLVLLINSKSFSQL